MSNYNINCTGDVVAGDIIEFAEGVFAGSFRSPRHIGNRIIRAEVIKESYGADKQQHTFTLRVIESDGVQPIAAGETIRRKGRNIYRNGTMRQAWADEAARTVAADEKHERGDAARAIRAARRAETEWEFA